MFWDKKPIVRFAPSPTGPFHMGSARTALYNYLFAKKEGGKMLLRIEDTDKERSKKEFEDEIYDSLKWLGLDWEGEVLRSSERIGIYKAKLQELIQNGHAYLSQETEGNSREVVRFRNPGGKIKFDDLIRGEIEEDVSDLKDFVIAKSLEEPLYHLAVVVDDMSSGVTHIIRGEDHISNTARQILISRALGKKEDFKYAHLPLVLAEDKSKLSKRKHGESVSLKYYRDRGYEPEAILNFLALIGWNPGGEEEIFGLEQLVKIFDLKKVQKKGGVFGVTKLRWVNKEHLKLQKDATGKAIEEKLNEVFLGKIIHPKLIETLFERIEVISDMNKLTEDGELEYFFNRPEIDESKICWKNQSKEDAKEKLEKVLEILTNKEEIMRYAEGKGKGQVLWPLRYALSGKEKSPDPFTLLDILGTPESKERINKVIELLSVN